MRPEDAAELWKETSPIQPASNSKKTSAAPYLPKLRPLSFGPVPPDRLRLDMSQSLYR